MKRGEAFGIQNTMRRCYDQFLEINRLLSNTNETRLSLKQTIKNQLTLSNELSFFLKSLVQLEMM